MINNIRQEANNSLKRLHEVDQSINIQQTYIDRINIEQKLIEYNKYHYKKVYESDAYNDKIYNKLQEDEIREKILNRELLEEEYNSKVVFNFLKLLQVPEQINKPPIFIPITLEE